MIKKVVTTDPRWLGGQLPRSIDVGDELDHEDEPLVLADVPIKTRTRPLMHDGPTIDEWCRICVERPTLR